MQDRETIQKVISLRAILFRFPKICKEANLSPAAGSHKKARKKKKERGKLKRLHRIRVLNKSEIET